MLNELNNENEDAVLDDAKDLEDIKETDDPEITFALDVEEEPKIELPIDIAVEEPKVEEPVVESKTKEKPAKKKSDSEKLAVHSTRNVTWPGVGKVYIGYNIVTEEQAEQWLTRDHIRLATPQEVAKEFGL